MPACVSNASLASATDGRPAVSVVIPTRDRPHLLVRAIASALAQTVLDIEVIVVIDGPDKPTAMAMARVVDPRVRLICLKERSGPSKARNAGCDAAAADWVAFLDDDDEWLPEKLKRQLEVAAASSLALPVVATQARVITPLATYVWPRRPPSANETMGDYLFARSSWFVGDGYIATPSLLVPRALLQSVRFDEALAFGEDNDWLLRIAAVPGVGLIVLTEPLCIVHTEDGRQSASNTRNWELTVNWARQNRERLSARAYAGLCLRASDRAAAMPSWRAFRTILRELFRQSLPTPRELVIFAAAWAVPRGLRRRARAVLAGRPN
jgi:glycosyltransferase involved in cell wall biosynthesis